MRATAEPQPTPEPRISVGYECAATAYRKFCIALRQTPTAVIDASNANCASWRLPSAMTATPTNTAATAPAEAMEAPTIRDP